MNIYIANLNSLIDNEALSNLFHPFGDVKSARIAKDVFTGESRGFGYVEMEEDDAQTAINELNQTSLNNLKLTVKKAPATVEPKGSYKVGSGAVNAYRFKKN